MHKKPTCGKKQIALWGLVIVLAVLAIALRVYNLPFASWWMDEAISVIAAKNLLADGLLAGIAQSGHPLWSMVLALSVWIGGTTHTATRIPSVLAGIAVIPVIFFFAKHLLSTRIALVTTFLTAFSYLEIAWARQARFYALYQLLFWLALLCYLLYRKKGGRRYLACAIISAILCVATNLSGVLIIPILALIHWFTREQTPKPKAERPRWQLPLLLLAGAALCVLGLAHLPNILESDLIRPVFYLPAYARFLREHFPIIMLLALIPLFWLGKTQIQQAQKNNYLILYANIGIPLLVFSFLVRPLNYRYLFIFLPALFILASATLLFLYDWFRKKHVPQAIPIALFAIYLLFSPTFQFVPLSFYELESDKTAQVGHTVYTPQPPWNDGYAVISSQKKEDDILISSDPETALLYAGGASYWLGYSHDPDKQIPTTSPRTNLSSIISAEDLTAVTREHSGYLIFDQLAKDSADEELMTFIPNNLELIYTTTHGQWSTVWVYRF